MRTVLAAGMTLALVAFLALPASAASAPAAAPVPKATPAPTGPGSLFVDSEEGNVVKLKLSGMLRERFEFRKNYETFTSDRGDNRDWLETKVLLGFQFELNENVEVFVQPAATFVWGGRRTNSGTDSLAGDTTSSDSDSLDIYQAYVVLHPDLGEGTILKVGRQELAFGSQMVLGSNSRYEGKSFDAIRLDLQLVRDLTTSLFGSKVVENDRAIVDGASTDIGVANRSDVHLFGLWNTYTDSKDLPDTTIDAYFLLWQADRGLSRANPPPEFQPQTFPFLEGEIYTLGARVKVDPIEFAPRHAADLDFSIELAGQFGRYMKDNGTNIDVGSAYGFETELGLKLGTVPLTPRVAMGLALASGDKQTAGATTNDTFTPLYENTEGRLGDADMMSLSNLKCWYFKASLNPAEKLEVGAAYFRFQAQHTETAVGGGNLTQPTNGNGAFDTSAALANRDSGVGDEFDVYADYKLSKSVGVRATYAMLDPADFITKKDAVDTGNSPASRFFLTLTVKW